MPCGPAEPSGRAVRMPWERSPPDWRAGARATEARRRSIGRATGCGCGGARREHGARGQRGPHRRRRRQWPAGRRLTVNFTSPRTKLLIGFAQDRLGSRAASGMTAFCDTSMLVAVCVRRHPHHVRAQPVLADLLTSHAHGRCRGCDVSNVIRFFQLEPVTPAMYQRAVATNCQQAVGRYNSPAGFLPAHWRLRAAAACDRSLPYRSQKKRTHSGARSIVCSSCSPVSGFGHTKA